VRRRSLLFALPAALLLPLSALAEPGGFFIFLQILNADELAREQTADWAIDWGRWLGLDIEGKVYAAVASRMQEGFERQGLALRARSAAVTVPETMWLRYDPDRDRTRVESGAAGTYRGVVIEVLDVNAIATAERRPGVIRLARALGVNLDWKVASAVAETCLVRLTEMRVRALVTVQPR